MVLNQNPKIFHIKYTLILKMSSTSICFSRLGFGSPIYKTLKSYNLCIQNSTKTHLGVLEPHVNY